MCIGRTVRICVRFSGVGVVYPCGVRGCLRVIYLFPLKSTSTARMPSRPNVYGSAPRWWCTLKNWLSSPLDAICTERSPAPSITGNHDARMLGTTIPALPSHLLCAPTLLPLRTVVGSSSQNKSGATQACGSRCG